MKKAAFIVEQGFVENHFGVRNYFSTIKSVLDEMGIYTDYVLHTSTRNGMLWYKANVKESKQEPTDRYLECWPQGGNGPRTISLSAIEKLNSGNKHLKPRKYLRCLGESLASEHYDYAVITNPWTVDFDQPIEANHTIGIVHDFVANMYVLTKPETGFDWGHMHQFGYQYYNRHCDRIMANSSEVARQYRMFFPQQADKVGFFLPFVPYVMRNASYEIDDKKEDAIILAAPFDLRKGLKDMPAILNGLDNVLDTLYIFGTPRCSIEDYDEFFSSLRVKHVVYYPSISSSGLIELYKKCKYLLFPSLEEGLGIPILEAQVCGCRAIVRDIAPMNNLVLDGSVVLSGELSTDLETIKSGMADDSFAYYDLSCRARKVYLFDGIKDFFQEDEA